MIDLHCHVLPGIDDGPPTIEDALALARVAAAAGTTILVATSHVGWHYRNDSGTIAPLVREVNTRLAVEGIALEVRGGAEIALTLSPEIATDELGRLTLGGGPWLLLEPPFTPAAAGLDLIVDQIRRRGFRVVLAHPERCPAFHRDPRMLADMVDAGVLLSVTAGSLTGLFGTPVRRFAMELMRDGLVHNVASDAHDAVNRPPGTAQPLAQAGLAELADWLTREVPAAILDGGEIPPRPATAPQPRRRWPAAWRRRSD